jgi:hypothetical protein
MLAPLGRNDMSTLSAQHLHSFFPMESIPIPIRYHQMVTHPPSCISSLQPKFASSVPRPPLRSCLGIRHSAVKDFSADKLWEEIIQSQTHDVSRCSCCTGKGMQSSSAEFVLVVCGSLVRESTRKGHSSMLYFLIHFLC